MVRDTSTTSSSALDECRAQQHDSLGCPVGVAERERGVVAQLVVALHDFGAAGAAPSVLAAVLDEPALAEDRLRTDSPGSTSSVSPKGRTVTREPISSSLLKQRAAAPARGAAGAKRDRRRD